MSLDPLAAALGATPGESLVAAARRVVAERDGLRRIVDHETPIGAFDLATTWRAERAMLQDEITAGRRWARAKEAWQRGEATRRVVAERLKLGDKVVCTTHYLRLSRAGLKTDNKVWVKRFAYPKPRAGLFLGYRTLQNGTRTYEDEVGYIFEPSEYIKAALVVFSEHTNPVYVPLDCMEADE